MIYSLFRRMLSVLLSRAFWTVIGLLFASLLIWFVGPIVAFGEIRPLEGVSTRVWTIVALVAYFVLRHFVRRWRKVSTNVRVVDRLMNTLLPTRAEESDEARLLRLRFDEALKILRHARFAKGGASIFARLMGGGRYLYELPWYIIIGAPGAGKTTALLNSGLSFPLAKSHGKGAVKGVGGTRHCDWWFTDEAVLIDTAGRYTTHETDADADKAEWQSFLGLLRKTRASQPLNGVLLTLSVSELLDAGADGRKAHAATLRQRLDELRNDLGIEFPVYLLVNKCDLLSGFDEYFANLDRTGREQVWGFTAPHVEGAANVLDVEAMGRELALLKKRVHDGLVDTLQGEPELARRALIYSFPQQFALLCEVISDVTAAVFSDSRFSGAPLLRGVYFTSGTQEGTPLDRVLSILGAPAARQERRVAGQGKSYFLNELLTRVVFEEAHLAGKNRRVSRRQRLFQLSAYALSAFLLLGALAAWAVSYRNNLAYLAEVERKTERLDTHLQALSPAVDGNLYALLGTLSEAETVADSAAFPVPQPLLAWTFGLYQGDKLHAGAHPVYEALLRERLAPALNVRLENLLRTIAVDDLEFAYEILKAYLMLHDPAHFNADEFRAFVMADWDYNMPAGAAAGERAALERHVSALASLGGMASGTAVDDALVASTRARLSQYSSAQRTYRRLVRALTKNALPEFSVGGTVGPGAPTVFRRVSGRPLTDGVASLYTYRGYHELFEKEVANVLRYVGKDETWVLGVSEKNAKDRAEALASGELALEVKRLYMWDYIARWEQFLDDVDIVAPTTLSAATELARILSSPDSPLSRLMVAVVRETTLLKQDKSDVRAEYSMFDRVRRTARATSDDVTRIVGPSALPGKIGPAERPELIVDNRFEVLLKSVGKGAEGAAVLGGSAQGLSELYLLLSSAEAARAGGYPPPNSDLPARLQAEAARLPQPGRRLLETLAHSGATLVARETRVAKSKQLVGTVTRSCREAIEGRYPFVQGTANEVAAGDFTRLFGPGGMFDSYFQTELAPFVDASTHPWRLRSGAQGGLGAGGELSAFERADVIKDVFFRSGSGAPTVTVIIKPVVMDPSITSLVLDVDGQVVRYQHGPQVGHTLRWPGPKGSNQIRVSMEPALAGQTSGLVIDGPWALHRLLDRAEFIAGDSPERFRAVVNVGGRHATFEITASSVKNPFRLKEMREFRCPTGL